MRPDTRDINAVDSLGNTALHNAFLDRSPATTIESLLRNGAGASVSIANKEGDTVLHIALKQIDETTAKKVEKLLPYLKPSDIEAKDRDGETALGILLTQLGIFKALHGDPRVYMEIRKMFRDVIARSGVAASATSKPAAGLPIEPTSLDEWQDLLEQLFAKVANTKTPVAESEREIEAIVNSLIAADKTNVTDKKGRTALHLILINPRNPNNQTIDDIELVEESRLKLAEKLLARGADLYGITHNGSTTLHFAANYRCVKAAELIMGRSGYTLVNHQDKDGNTPLHKALLRNDSLDLVRTMIKCGANAEIKNRDGVSANEILRRHATEISARQEHLSMEIGKASKTVPGNELSLPSLIEEADRLDKLILEYSSINRLLLSMSDPYAPKTAIGEWISKTRTKTDLGIEVLMLLRTCKHGDSLAIKHIREESLAKLIADGADVRVYDLQSKLSTLHIVASFKETNLAKMLLDAGADPNVRDANGQLPLNIAAEFYNQDIIDLLLEKGANVEEAHKNTLELPIHLAASSGHIKTLQAYIEAGIPASLRNHEGFTPLHQAAYNGKSEAIEYLLSKGANINESCSAKEKTALFITINGLLQESKDDKLSPDEVALKNTSYIKTFELLLSKGASPAVDNLWKKEVITNLERGSKREVETEAKQKPLTEILALFSSTQLMEEEAAARKPKEVIRKGRQRKAKAREEAGLQKSPQQKAAEIEADATATEETEAAAAKKAQEEREAADAAPQAEQPLQVEALQTRIMPLAISNETKEVLREGKEGGVARIERSEEQTLRNDGAEGKAAPQAELSQEATEIGAGAAEEDASQDDEAQESTPIHSAPIKAPQQEEAETPPQAELSQKESSQEAAENKAKAEAATGVARIEKEIRAKEENRDFMAENAARIAAEEAQLLSDKAQKLTPLHRAAINGSPGVTEGIIRSATRSAIILNFNAQCNLGWSPLHYAAFYGNTADCEILIRHGASLDLKDNQGLTPLHIAAINGRNLVIEKMIQTGASVVDTLSTEGASPLHYAAFHGHFETCRTLLNRGASLDLKDNQGLTPLHRATINGNPLIIEEMIQARVARTGGANVDILSTKRASPLHYAAAHGRIEACRTLLCYNASVNLRDSAGYTPLTYAAFNGNHDICRLLLSIETNPAETAESVRTTFQMASAAGHQKAANDLTAALASTLTTRSAESERLLQELTTAQTFAAAAAQARDAAAAENAHLRQALAEAQALASAAAQDRDAAAADSKDLRRRLAALNAPTASPERPRSAGARIPFVQR